MKTILLLLFIPPLISYSQPTSKVDGFFGIGFATSIEEVTKTMSIKNAKIDTKNEELIIYEGTEFGGRKSVFVSFEFYENKLCGGMAMFNSDLKSGTIPLYNSLVKDITDKYGDGLSKEEYDYPYEKGDGHTITAISIGSARFNTHWPNLEGGSISVIVTKDHNIGIIYKDKLLTFFKEKEEKSKNSKDF